MDEFMTSSGAEGLTLLSLLVLVLLVLLVLLSNSNLRSSKFHGQDVWFCNCFEDY